MRYKTVVITGASSGLGEEFAKQMAPDSEHLVLVARRGDRLDALKEALLGEFLGLEVSVEVVDLNDREGLEEFCGLLQSRYEPHVLVNNAGMGDLGSFEKAEWAKLESMMQLNMAVLTRITHAVIPGMSELGGGFIMNVSSMASIMPIPDFAVYAATKAYVTSFSEALRLELREKNIFVTALCPGPVKTEFGEVARRTDNKKESEMQSFAYVSKEECVREALCGMDVQKATVFPGGLIKASTLFFKLLPMPLLRAIMGRRPRRID